jgi:hypothetical protein
MSDVRLENDGIMGENFKSKLEQYRHLKITGNL